MGRPVLEELLGARSKVQILRALSGMDGREVATEDLARLTELSTGTLVPALKQLVEQRIVATRRLGKARVFRLSDRHPAQALVRHLFQEEGRVIQQATEFLLAKVKKAKVRYVAWFNAPMQSPDRRPVWLLVIADDPDRCRKVFEEAEVDRPWLHLDVRDEASLKAELADAQSPYAEILRHGRVVYADRDWLSASAPSA